MHIPDEYISMTRASQEVQDWFFTSHKRFSRTGDLLFTPQNIPSEIFNEESQIKLISSQDTFVWPIRYREDLSAFWIPRLDDIQAFFKPLTHESLYRLFQKWLEEWVSRHKNTKDQTHEMLWFHFLMEVKFKRAWNGREWIRIREIRK